MITFEPEDCSHAHPDGDYICTREAKHEGPHAWDVPGEEYKEWPRRPESKTVRVRIAVGVDANGHWFIPMQSNGDSERYLRIATAKQDGTFYVGVDVPTPRKREPQTVEGEVVG